jgi:hypothetical protein
MEVKVDIKPYKSDIGVVNLNHWLQILEAYFNFNNIDRPKYFICLTETRGTCTNLVGKVHGDTYDGG